jgi:hypothetical protein
MPTLYTDWISNDAIPIFLSFALAIIVFRLVTRKPLINILQAEGSEFILIFAITTIIIIIICSAIGLIV